MAEANGQTVVKGYFDRLPWMHMKGKNLSQRPMDKQ